MEATQLTGMTRLFPGAAPPGHNEDNGTLLVAHILWGLPADVLQLVSATSKPLSRATAGFTGRAPDCGQPLIDYTDALITNHMTAMYWYLTSEYAERYMRLLGPPPPADDEYVEDAEYSDDGDGDSDDDYDDYESSADEDEFSEATTVTTVLAAYGHIDAIRLARALGCPWCPRTYEYAAMYGHLNILQYALADGCPRGEAIGDHYVCNAAASSGDLEVLQWALANGFTWGTNTLAHAAMKSHLHILQWAFTQNPPCPHDGDQLMDCAAIAALEVLQWVHAHARPRRIHFHT